MKKRRERIIAVLMASMMICTTPLNALAAEVELFGDDIQVEQQAAEEEAVGEKFPEETEIQEETEDFSSDEDEISFDEEESGTDEETDVQETELAGEEAGAEFSDEGTTEQRTVAECLDALYAAFRNYKIGTALKFPYGTDEGQYTNAGAFIQAEIEKIVPKTEYEVKFNYSNVLEGGTGSIKKELTMDKETLDIEPVHAATDTKPGFTGVTFSIGDQSTAKIQNLYLAVAPIEMTAQEAVDYEAGLIDFNYIKGTNTSQEQIVSPVGKTNGSSVGALPTTPDVYKDKNKELEVAIKWNLNYVSGKEDSIKLASNKTTVVRPNVGEADGKYQLQAIFTNKLHPEITKTVNFDLTVPAFKEAVLPVRVSPADAKLTVTDKYYNNKEVAENYISSEEEGALRKYTLHGGSKEGTAQTYSWKAEKKGYITKTGTFNVSSGEQTEQSITLSPSSEDDCKLASLSVSKPEAGAPSIKTPMGEFDKDKENYEITVNAIDFIVIKAAAVVPEATVNVTRYGNANNANQGTLSKPTGLSALSEMNCYLKPEGETVITIDVTVPTGSTQTTTKKTYTLTVKKSGEAEHSLKSLTVKASNSQDLKIGASTLKNTGYTEEEVLSPSLDKGGIAETYRYEVNYYRDQVSLTPTLTAGTADIEIQYQKDGKEESIAVTDKKASANIPVETGNNRINIVVTKNKGTDTETSETYPLLIYRKQKPEGTLKIKGTESTFSFDVKNDWTGKLYFPHSLREVPVEVNVPENVVLKLQGQDTEYRNGDTMTISVDDKEKVMPVLFWIRTVTDPDDSSKTIQEVQKYVVSYNRVKAESPDLTGAYLPAPGQFVNNDTYNEASATLVGPSGGRMVTLGSFGGSITYKFDEPVENSAENPYGVDFIVFGNVQKSTAGESYASGMEPAAVMVSQDGNTWYELAGSDYYARSTEHNVSVTYTNPDTEFKSAVDIPWTGSNGSSGSVKANSYHSQPYYPDPLTYKSMNSGVGANDSYKAESMTVTGTRVSNSAALRFGYGDTHANADSDYTNAVNPYRENPYYGTNGDGMDISWAVDSDGNHVDLDSIQYVKIYTAQSKDNGSMGEVSSEISGVLRVQPSNEAVGVTEDLKSINIDGNDVALTAGKYTYDVSVNDVSSFRVIPEARKDSNIYVSNQWVKSGTKSGNISVDKTLRVIVQDGQKEPVIYYFNLTGTADPANNTTLEGVSVAPGELSAAESDGGYTVEVPDICEKIRISAPTMNSKASVKINGKDIAEDGMSSVITLNDTETTAEVEVTSESGIVSKTYTVTVKKVPAEKTVNVKFSLVGDENHGKATHNWWNLWMNQLTCKVPADSTAKFVTEMFFLNNDIPFEEKDGNYISSINGLKEKDNGPGSGWMYAINGTSDNVDAIDIQKVTEDSEIIWYYVDNYETKVPDLSNLNPDHVCKWDTGKVTKEATCTEAGTKVYTCTYCHKTRNESIPASGHKVSAWKKISDATVFQAEKLQGTCTVCGEKVTKDNGSKLTAAIKLNTTSIKLQRKQTTKKIKVTMAKGDSVKSWKSSNSKIVTVNKNGVIKAGKKTGTAKITVTLASGKKATLKVKVQKAKVKTTKITGLKSKVTMKKGEKLALKANLKPLTTQEKVTYKTSNKKVADVNKNGVITAKKKGTVKITVKSGSKKKVIKVTVK